jgi:hypothetical protein
MKPTRERWNEVEIPSPVVRETPKAEPKVEPVSSGPGIGRIQRCEQPVREPIGLFSDETKEKFRAGAEKAAAAATAKAEKLARVARDKGPGVGQAVLTIFRDRRVWISLAALVGLALVGLAGHSLYKVFAARSVTVSSAPATATAPGASEAPAPAASAPAPQAPIALAPPHAAALDLAPAKPAVPITTPPVREPKGFPAMPGDAPEHPSRVTQKAPSKAPAYEEQEKDIDSFFKNVNESKH